MKKDREKVQVTIEKLVFGGKGLARLDSGQVIFVVGDVLPGEEALVEVYKKKKDYKEARVVERLTNSPKRIPAPCPYFGKCGGCTIQSLTYDDQLALKQDYVAEVIHSHETLKSIPINTITPSTLEWHYRLKLELTFFAENDGSVSLGFFYKGTWFRIVDIDTCLLFDQRVIDILVHVRNWFTKHGFPAFHNKRFDGLLRNLVIKKTYHTNEWMIGLVTTEEELTEVQLHELYDMINTSVPVQSFYHRIIKKKRRKGESYTDTLLFGKEYITEKLYNLDYRIRFADFFQNNVLQAENMIQYVLDYIPEDTETLLDLYCGVGTFTLPIAMNKKNVQVTGVELVQTAIDSAQENADLNTIEGINFICSDVGKVLTDIAEGGFDCIVVDPPRAGLTKDVVDALNASQAKTLIYVSCNPSTFARDLVGLQSQYIIEFLQPFDLFPQTYHVEMIAVLRKR